MDDNGETRRKIRRLRKRGKLRKAQRLKRRLGQANGV
jgi:hypothetical protein